MQCGACRQGLLQLSGPNIGSHSACVHPGSLVSNFAVQKPIRSFQGWKQDTWVLPCTAPCLFASWAHSGHILGTFWAHSDSLMTPPKIRKGGWEIDSGTNAHVQVLDGRLHSPPDLRNKFSSAPALVSLGVGSLKIPFGKSKNWEAGETRPEGLTSPGVGRLSPLSPLSHEVASSASSCHHITKREKKQLLEYRIPADG